MKEICNKVQMISKKHKLNRKIISRMLIKNKTIYLNNSILRNLPLISLTLDIKEKYILIITTSLNIC